MKYLILLAATALIISSCNQAELDQAKQQNDSLAMVVHDRDSVLNDFLYTFNQIERNLDQITVKQNYITVNTGRPGELATDTKERINNNINAINELMEKNNKKIAALSKKLKNSDNQLSQMKKTIALLNEQLQRKSAELAELNEKLIAMGQQLVELQATIDTLNAAYAAQAETIEQQRTALHTVYYVVGKAKDLQKAEVLDKNGGLLGIGKTTNLSNDFNDSLFVSIDYTETSSITIEGKHAKIITTHPSGTYEFETEEGIIKNLVITNPEKFWGVSKYLVVVKD